MATHLDQPSIPTFEKVLSQNSVLAEKFLGVFKHFIATVSVFPEVLKAEITQATKEYLQTTFNDLSIDLQNIDDLTSFLINHIDAIQPIIEACKSVKKDFLESKGLSLILEKETEDLSGEQNITLYVRVNKKTSELNTALKKIIQPYQDYFINADILFTAQFDINK